MKTKQFLFIIIVIFFLLSGACCNKKPDKPEMDEKCFDCYESEYQKDINNITGIVVFNKSTNTFIISVDEDDINGINSLEPDKWNTSNWSYIYIPCPELTTEFQKTGTKVLVSGELFSCSPGSLPWAKFIPSGELLKKYKIKEL